MEGLRRRKQELVVGALVLMDHATGDSMMTTLVDVNDSSTEGDGHERLGGPESNEIQEKC